MAPATIDIKQAPIRLKKPYQNKSSYDTGKQLRLKQQNITEDTNSNRNYYREYADQELTGQHFMRSNTNSDRNEAQKRQLNIDVSKDVTTQMRDTVAEEESLHGDESLDLIMEADFESPEKTSTFAAAKN